MNLYSYNTKYYHKRFHPTLIDGATFKTVFPTFEDHTILMTGLIQPEALLNETIYNLLLGIYGNIYFNRGSIETILPHYGMVFKNAYMKYNLVKQMNEANLEDLLYEVSEGKNSLHDGAGYETPKTMEEFIKYVRAYEQRGTKSRKSYLNSYLEIQSLYLEAEQTFIENMRNAFIISMEHSTDGGN